MIPRSLYFACTDHLLPVICFLSKRKTAIYAFANSRMVFGVPSFCLLTCRSGTITSSGNQCNQKVVAYLREVCYSRLKRILARLLILGKSLSAQPYNYWGLVGFGLSVSFLSIFSEVQAPLIQATDFPNCFF